MKVFVPLHEQSVIDQSLSDAPVVPFEQGYTLLHIERAHPDAPLPAMGLAQIIPPEDWPQQPQSLPQTSA